MTTASPASPPSETPVSSLSLTGRLRRLSQLRTHSNHQTTTQSTSSHRSYRTSFTRAVGLISPHSPPATDIDAEHAAHELEPTVSVQSAPARPLSDTSETLPQIPAFMNQTGGRGSRSSGSSEARSDALSHSSQSTPENEPEMASASLMPGQETALREPATAQAAASENMPPQSTQSIVPRTLENQSSSSNPLSNSTSHSNNVGQPTSSDPESSKSPPQATIRLFPYQDPHQSTRPSLPFTPVARTLPNESCIIKVGRYSERDGIPAPNPGKPSASPVGFKSKVVSRKHCEFSFINGQWHVKDVGSSSGTFLNHMRLSQPNMPSRQYSVRDGDIVQLGIDFRGGEEMIFRCVRIRIECNRLWQQKANEFNKNTESLINSLGKGSNTDFSGCRECSICLGSVLRPYQCLFMAACAHVWHYKCIRRLIHTPEYPMFQCPNCRAYTDLSAEVDDSNDFYDGEERVGPPSARDNPVVDTTRSNGDPNTSNAPTTDNGHNGSEVDQLAAAANNMTLENPALAVQNGSAEDLNQEPDNATPEIPPPDEPPTEIPRSPNIAIPTRRPPDVPEGGPDRRAQPAHGHSPAIRDQFEDCPLTPRNDLGPLAFDGRAGRL